MSEARVNNLSNESNTGGPTLSGITTFSGTNYFVPPVGTTAQRPQDPQKGSIRFNTDTYHLEYYRGDTIGWSEIEASHNQLGGGTGSNKGTGVRGVFGLGFKSPGNTQVIEYITISTLGDAQTFGESTRGDRHGYSGVSSRTRGCWGGGFPQATQTTIDYITFSQLGNATDFGDMSAGRIGAVGFSNEIRGCWMGGYSYSPGPQAARDVIDYITIASTGNAKDFGNLLSAKEFSSQPTCASTTRGIKFRSSNNVIEYVTIATTGNAVDFGDSGATGAGGGLSNATRGIIAGGGSPGNGNTIEYITIATLGNSIDFGDLNQGNHSGSGTSSSTRGIVTGMKDPGLYNTIEYIEIPTTGNAIDFGNLTEAKSHMGACSNGHGGL